jgi:hypothetical protein
MASTEYYRSPYCEKPNCQRSLAQFVSTEKKSKQEALRSEITNQLKQSVVDLTELPTYEKIPIELLDSIQTDTPIVGLMPVNKNTLTELSEARKEAFLKHLADVFNDLKTDSEKTLKIYSNELEADLPEEEASLLGYACATCKGYCCGLGDTHGFLDYPSLEHYLSTQPSELCEEELKEAYRSYLPTQSYSHSCVFQGNQGCTLPREMRSFTCNNYRCSELTSYRQQVATSESKLTFAAAIDNEKIVGTSVFNAEHFARHK